jgi:hypothetical protein
LSLCFWPICPYFLTWSCCLQECTKWVAQKYNLLKWGRICCNNRSLRLATSWFRQHLAWSKKDLHLSLFCPSS